MKQINQEAINSILEAAKKEFMKNGFEKASVRSIAAEAKVTTGSIYAHFGSKEGLFDAIVSDAAVQCYNYMLAVSDSFNSLSEDEQMEQMVAISNGSSEQLIDFIYRHLDEFRLIACCSAGTDYENYIDRLALLEEKATADYIALLQKHGYEIKEIGGTTMHILVGIFFHSVFEIIAHDLPYEEAKEQIKIIQRFYTAGWLDLFGGEKER